ncbi:alpha/beta hydrolase (plasmid) [Mycolicibacterium madagascariense]|uniref:Alpha/beta hydrolase n=1 Tax=Mycolicibacterium madagascariense TaxID=212765 RepID=A0A7I7XPR7_9MYCO|nr:alpha/beta hydrolase [Mycolicibacterium madagascariense]BBZ31210.1 alpha/beta hydrolase [Mycolicibacterium madagascariense]
MVQDCEIRYQRTGVVGAPPLILIHGASGHSAWWTAVVPLLRGTHDVVTMDLSGHGDSGHRRRYDADIWADDVSAVVNDLDAGPAVLIGHSMGGLVALHTAGRHRHQVAAVVAVDSAVIPHRPLGTGTRGVKFYANQDEALANFRLRPRTSTADPALLASVARAGLRRDEFGWRWKFDPNALQRLSREELYESIRRITCPTGFIYGSRSELATAGTVQFLGSLMGTTVPHVVVNGAFHHVPLDAPVNTAAAIETLLSTLLPAHARSTSDPPVDRRD